MVMRSLIFRHAGLKLLSVLLAFLMWMLVSGERIVERAMRIPLEFTNLPTQLEAVGLTPDVVDVRVRGSSAALSRLAPGDVVAMLDLGSARAGLRLFTLTNGDVRVPFGLEVMQVAPSSLTMRFERSVAKTVPIVPAVDGQPADGFAAGAAVAEPSSVEIVGPESAVDGLIEATTEPVSVDGASAPVTEMVNVGVADPAVRLRGALRASVTVAIAPAPVEWTVSGVPVQIWNAARSTEVMPSEVTLFVRGPSGGRVSRPDAFTASIDVAGLRTGQHELPVSVQPPPGIGLVRVDPPVLRVRVR
jgi:hypothetical protein